MRTTKILVTVRFRWWFRWYVQGVVIMCWLTGREPNWEKFHSYVKKATVIA